MPDDGARVRDWTDLVRRARLGRTVKAVALMIATYADADGTRVYPGIATLAVACEIDYKTVQKALAELRRVGLLRLVRRSGRRGQADVYRLVIAAELLDLVEVLDPNQFHLAADRLRRPRGNRPADHPPADDSNERQPTAWGDVDDRNTTRQPTPTGDVPVGNRAEDVDNTASTVDKPVDNDPDPGGTSAHGTPISTATSAHGTSPRQPTALPPTIHRPGHKSYQPSVADLRTDVTARAREPATNPEDPEDSSRPRCPHGHGTRTRHDGRPRCPHCRGQPPGPAPGDKVVVVAYRRGIAAHRPADDHRTGCGRSTRTMHRLTAADATERHQVTWCPRCWPPTSPNGEP